METPETRRIVRRDGWATPLLLAGVAVALRLALIALAPETLPPPTNDVLERYLPIAAGLRTGEGFADNGVPTAEAPPIYPLLLAAIGATGPDDLTAIRVALSFGDGALVVLVVLLGRRLAGPGAAVLAGAVTALSPYFLYATFVAGNDGLFTLLNVAFLLALAVAVSEPNGRRFAAAGAVLGLATLCRAPALFLPLVVVPAALFAARVDRRLMARASAAFLTAFLLVLAPWTIRNALQFRRLIPIQTLGGVHLLMATGVRPPNLVRTDVTPPTTDSQLYSKALHTIAGDPGAYLQRAVRRARRLLFATHSRLHETVLLRANLAMLALAGCGLWLLRGCLRPLVPHLAVILYYVLLHSLTVALFRYMLPVVPLLTILAAVPVVRLRDRLTHAFGGMK